MPDMSLIAGAVSSLKLAQDMTKTLVSLRDFSKLNETVIELQRVILAAQSDALAAQSDQFSMLERVRDLEEEITRLKAWETEKQRYQLKECNSGVGTGSLAYMIKPEMQGAEPVHCLCTNCYAHGKKSIMQNTGALAPTLGRIWRCPDCNNTINIRQWPPPA
jgi:hypothetical protein